MGAIDFSLNPLLVDSLRDVLPLSTFVETGTFEGETVAGVIGKFDEIHSIELSSSHYDAATQRFAAEASVHLYYGDSAAVLGELRPQLGSASALYWLDAHWCEAEVTTESALDQCPLLRELSAIESLNDDSALLIDDARLFLAPPRPPHRPDEWPSLLEVVEALRNLNRSHALRVVNDVIAFVPVRASAALDDYSRRHGSEAFVDQKERTSLLAERDTQAAAAVERLQALTAALGECRRLEQAAAARLTTIEELEGERRMLLETLAKRDEALAALQRERDLQAAAAEERLAELEAVHREAELRQHALDELSDQRHWSR